jgi:hypothetical protein
MMRNDGLVDESRMALTIGQLRQACHWLLDEAERRHGSTFDLSNAGVDYYWNVDLASAFQLTERPEQAMDCGQVSDDVTEVADMLRRGEPPVLWHDLEHVVGLLRLLAFLDLPKGD